MMIWTLETESDFTKFYFPIEEDKILFHELVKKYFEDSKTVSENWRPLFMLRGEPLKHPDFFSIDDTGVIAISQLAVDNLQEFFNDAVELLPLETDIGKYYAMNVLNYVDCLNNTESKYEATKGGFIVNYSLLEFDEEKLGENYIFKIPEMPYQIFITDDIQEQCETENLNGLFFDSKRYHTISLLNLSFV